MSIRDDIKQLKTTERDLRKFGLTVGSVFAVLGLIVLWRHKTHWPYFLWLGVALIVLGLIVPRILKYIYIGWMSLAFVLGFIMAQVILTLFFFLVITPIGLTARLAGKDFLSLKLYPQSASYWIARERKIRIPSDYERQF